MTAYRIKYAMLEKLKDTNLSKKELKYCKDMLKFAQSMIDDPEWKKNG